ncbi:small ribosomal subunit protein bS6m [Prorops nasuta]|uniref:small ribosomal subunit protein bS6m n=1 Tax=Prorops nasuta TaxID=863751 RepID=UPI0034CD2521
MPIYELPLLLRTMDKPHTIATLKRATKHIFDQGGFLRKIENLGNKQLPSKASVHGHVYRNASYFILYFTAPPKSIQFLNDEYGRDVDIIRAKIFKQNELKNESCTFHEENLPVAYRPEVQKLIQKAQRLAKPKMFKYNSSTDFYPFQK